MRHLVQYRQGWALCDFCTAGKDISTLQKCSCTWHFCVVLMKWCLREEMEQQGTPTLAWECLIFGLNCGRKKKTLPKRSNCQTPWQAASFISAARLSRAGTYIQDGKGNAIYTDRCAGYTHKREAVFLNSAWTAPQRCLNKSVLGRSYRNPAWAGQPSPRRSPCAGCGSPPALWADGGWSPWCSVFPGSPPSFPGKLWEKTLVNSWFLILTHAWVSQSLA